MPELPEVETVRRGLESLVAGARVERAEVFRASCVRLLPGGAAEFASAVEGTSLAGVVRRGKFLWFPLEDGAALSAHLGMSGQFRVHVGDAGVPAPHAHCRARLHVRLGRERRVLDFLDQRTFGYLHAEQLVATTDGLSGGAGSSLAAVPASVAHIARDVLDPELDAAGAVRRLRRGSRGIKQVLLDQTVVSGVGNIYADEALWRARVHPERPAKEVTAARARDVLDALRAVMTDALAQGGTSFDALYVNVNGESGYFARSLDAYGRECQPCRRCGSAILRERVAGRSTHWCAKCQRRYLARAH